jgi:hypothetical protein
MERGEVLIESYYHFGKVTFKFFSKDNSSSEEWALSTKKKSNAFVEEAKRDSTKDYASRITLKGHDEMPFQRVMSKEEGRDFWNLLINNDFHPTKGTAKKL